MSRSRRKTPIFSMTLAESEKDDKRLAARRERSWVASRLLLQTAIQADFDLPRQNEHHRSGQWTFSKDGKKFYESRLSNDVLKWMRK